MGKNEYFSDCRWNSPFGAYAYRLFRSAAAGSTDGFRRTGIDAQRNAHPHTDAAHKDQ